MPDASGCEQSPCGCALQQGARAAAALAAECVTSHRASTAPAASSAATAAYAAGPTPPSLRSTAAMQVLRQSSLPPPPPPRARAHLPHSLSPGAGNKFRRSDQLFIELFVRKYPRILVRGQFLPQFPSAACTAAAAYPSKTPPSSPPQQSLQGDGQLAENDP
jgi:hypothetical protein